MPSGRSRPGLLGFFGEWLGTSEVAALPVELVQSLFFMLDPFLGQRKFVRFAGLDPTGAEARGFVALEDWINDGVPLPIAVARECFGSWYGDNAPGRGLWQVAGTKVQAAAIAPAGSGRDPRPRPDRAAGFGRAAGGGDPQRRGAAPAARPYRHDVRGARA